MSINMIVACNELGYIGKNNELLYYIKEDLKRFRQLTEHNIVVFGKKTYESLPNKPLHKRLNVILTRSNNYKAHPCVMIEHDLDRVINYYLTTGTQDKELFICGGEQIYKQAFQFCEKIYLTMIHDSSKIGDVKFPLEMLSDFVVVDTEEHYSDEYNCRYEFITYERNKMK